MSSETLLLRIIEMDTKLFLVGFMGTTATEPVMGVLCIEKEDHSLWSQGRTPSMPALLQEMEITALDWMSSLLSDWRPEVLQVIYTRSTPVFERVDYSVDINNEPRCAL